MASKNRITFAVALAGWKEFAQHADADAKSNKKLGDSASKAGQEAEKGGRGWGIYERKIKRGEKANKEAALSFGSLAKKAAALGAAYVGIGQAKDAAETTEALGHSIIGLNRSFGLSVESASRWAAVSKARGTDGKALTMGFKALATATRNARQGIAGQGDAVDALRAKQDRALQQAMADGKKQKDLDRLRSNQAAALDALSSKTMGQAKVFGELGISQRDLAKHGNDLEWVLARVSDGLAKLPTGTEKSAIAAKLFGRTWTSIAPLIRSGSKEMDAQLKLADKYGLVFKDKDIKTVEDLIKAQREAKLATLGLQVAEGKLLLPVMTKMSEVLPHITQNLREGDGAWGILRATITTVGVAGRGVVNFFDRSKVASDALGVSLVALGGLWAVHKVLSWVDALKKLRSTTLLLKAANYALGKSGFAAAAGEEAAAAAGGGAAAGGAKKGLLKSILGGGAAGAAARWGTKVLRFGGPIAGVATVADALVSPDSAGEDPARERAKVRAAHLAAVRRRRRDAHDVGRMLTSQRRSSRRPSDDLLGLPRLSPAPAAPQRRAAAGHRLMALPPLTPLPQTDASSRRAAQQTDALTDLVRSIEDLANRPIQVLTADGKVLAESNARAVLKVTRRGPR